MTSGTAPDGELIFPGPGTSARLKFDEAIDSESVMIVVNGGYDSSEMELMPYFDSESVDHWHILIDRNDTPSANLFLQIDSPAFEASCSATITDAEFVAVSTVDITLIVHNTPGARRVRMWVFTGHDFTAQSPDLDTDVEASCSGIAATTAAGGANVGVIGEAVTFSRFRVAPLPVP